MASIEEKVEEQYKMLLNNLHVRHYGKTETINESITQALKNADSKSGNSGNNYPDIKLLLEDAHSRRIPVMIEAKGSKGKLEKLAKDGSIELVTVWEQDSKPDAKNPHKAGDNNYATIQGYAVNGALHYGNAILDEGTYSEVIIMGINGTTLDKDGRVLDAEHKAYYVSEKNSRVPKAIELLNKDLAMLKADNIPALFAELDKLNLTDAELEVLTRKAETTLEDKVKKIHQQLYDNEKMKALLSTNEKLYLFCGLIMAGLTTQGIKPLDVSELVSNDDTDTNDGTIILGRVKSFLRKKNCSAEKIEMVLQLLEPVFKNAALWRPDNGESILKSLFKQIKTDIVPCLESNLRLDFTGKILNSLNDWVSIENDAANDVVLTPRYVTMLMAKLARTNMNSFVWDRAMGSAGFLVSAMDIMIKDAKEKIADSTTFEAKVKDIKEKQLLGIEILGNIYILAVLNMILMGDGSSNIICGDSHRAELGAGFPATVFLLNPPYSAPGKGFIFVKEALEKMTTGYACVLIQENAGSGLGLPYTKAILQNNTLLASIHMPDKLFSGKASVQTAIYVFQVARPHEKDDIVTFIDFSNDGYSRQNRKKSTQEVNLRDTDHAAERYTEIEAIVLGKKPKTDYYTEANGLVIKDTITLEGNDWTFNQHKKIDTMPTEEDFKRTVQNYLAWKVGAILRGEIKLPEDNKADDTASEEGVTEE